MSWFALTAGRGRRVIAALGVPLLAFGCMIGFAISFSGYYDGLRLAHPDTYWSLNRLASPLPTAMTIDPRPSGDRARVPSGLDLSGERQHVSSRARPGFGCRRRRSRSTSSRRATVTSSSHRRSYAVRTPGPARSRSRSKPTTVTCGACRSRRRRAASRCRFHRGLNRIELRAWKGTHGESIARLVTVNGLRLGRV